MQGGAQTVCIASNTTQVHKASSVISTVTCWQQAHANGSSCLKARLPVMQPHTRRGVVTTARAGVTALMSQALKTSFCTARAIS
jgi:ribosomal protein L35AE/L33A